MKLWKCENDWLIQVTDEELNNFMKYYPANKQNIPDPINKNPVGIVSDGPLSFSQQLHHLYNSSKTKNNLN